MGLHELSSNSKRLKCKVVRHRLILDTVAHDSSSFIWCKVLLSCIADAVEGTCSILLFEKLAIQTISLPAAQQAYKVSILHRDLSSGNIMIVKYKETKEWRGLPNRLGCGCRGGIMKANHLADGLVSYG